MSLRTGHRVKIKAADYLAYIEIKKKDPNFLRMLEMLERSETKSSPMKITDRLQQEATITGLPLGGDYANLRFDDGYECSMPIRFVERLPK